MANYKILVIGHGEETEDMFTCLDDSFELMTSSNMYSDMNTHIKYFKPDFFVYIISDDQTEDDMIDIFNYKMSSLSANIVFIIAGKDHKIAEFKRKFGSAAQLEVSWPFEPYGLKDSLTKLGNENFGRSSGSSGGDDEDDGIQAEMDSLKNSSRRKHVLVIDDSPIMLKLVKEKLKDKYDVATAISGQIAYKYLEKNDTDFVLLDYEMPGENGIEVFAKLRENPKTKRTPIAFLTAISERDKITEVLKLKPQGYVLKPIDQEKLLSTIKEFIGE